MPGKLGQAILELVTDDGALEKGLDASKQKAQGWGAGLGTIGKAGALAFAGVTAAVSLVTGTLTASALSVAADAGEVSKLRRELGITTEEASKLRYEGGRMNIDVDALSKSFGVLSKSLESSHPSLEKYNIAVVRAKDGHIDMEATLGKVADRFKSLPDGAEKTALSMDIFGKSGKDLIPLLNQGSDGLKAMGEEATKLGLVFDDKTLASAKRLAVAHKDLDDRLEGLKNRIGIAFLPVLADWTGALVNAADAVLPSVGAALETVTGWLGKAIDAIKGPASAAVDLVVGAVKTFADLWQGGDVQIGKFADTFKRIFGVQIPEFVLQGVGSVVAGLSRIPAIIGGVAGSIGEIFDVATGRRPEAGGVLKSLVGDEKAADIMGVVGRVRDKITDAFDLVGPVIQRVVDKVGELRQKFEELPPAVQQFAAMFTVVAAGAVTVQATGLDQTFSNIAQGIGGVVSTLMALATTTPAAIGAFVVAAAPIVLVVAIIAGLIAIFLNWDTISKNFIADINGYGGPITSVGNLFSALGTRVREVFDGIGAAIGAFFSGIGAAVRNFLTFWEDAWSAFSSRPAYWLGVLVGLVIGGLVQLIARIESFALSAVEQFVLFGIHSVQAITSWIGETKTAIWNFFTGLPGQVGAWLGSVVQRLFGFKDEGVQAATSFTTQTGQSFTDWFVSLPGKFWDAAVAAVRGLIGGFGSMVSEAWNSVASFFGGIVDGVKGALGIHSPSTVFQRLGEEIVNGLTLGFTNSAPAAIKAVKTLLADVQVVSHQISEAMLFNTKFGTAVVQPGSEGLGLVQLGQQRVGSAGNIPLFGRQVVEVPVYLDGRQIAQATNDRFTTASILAGAAPA